MTTALTIAACIIITTAISTLTHPGTITHLTTKKDTNQ